MSCIIQICRKFMYYPNMVTICNTFLMMILFVYVTVLSVLCTDEKPQFSQMG